MTISIFDHKFYTVTDVQIIYQNLLLFQYHLVING